MVQRKVRLKSKVNLKRKFKKIRKVFYRGKKTLLQFVNSKQLLNYGSYLGYSRRARNVALENYSLCYRKNNLILNTNLTSVVIKKFLMVIMKLYARKFFKNKNKLLRYKRNLNVNFQYDKVTKSKFKRLKLFGAILKKKKKVKPVKKMKISDGLEDKEDEGLTKRKTLFEKPYRFNKMCIINEYFANFLKHEKWFKKYGLHYGLNYKYNWIKGYLTNRPRKVWKKKPVKYDKLPSVLVVISSYRYQDIANEARKKGIPSVGIVTSRMDPVFTYNIVVGRLNKQLIEFFLKLIIETIKVANYSNKFVMKYLDSYNRFKYDYNFPKNRFAWFRFKPDLRKKNYYRKENYKGKKKFAHYRI